MWPKHFFLFLFLELKYIQSKKITHNSQIMHDNFFIIILLVQRIVSSHNFYIF